MLIPKFTVNSSLGNHMNQFLFRLVIAAAALAPASSVLAADLDIPPPVEQLRPATFDWSGPYAGAFVGGVAQTGTYDTFCLLCGTGTREMNGVGWNAGVLAGWNYQVDSLVMGVEGDWAFGGKVATNDDPNELTSFEFNNIATLRARLGMAFDDTLVYATGGVAFADSTFATTDYPTGSGFATSDSKWVTGWLIGAGMEHAFSDRLSGRIEYTYMSLPDTVYTLVNGASTVDVTQAFDGIHTVRAALTYNFGW
jgi:outer membrane immunogenic protein